MSTTAPGRFFSAQFLCRSPAAGERGANQGIAQRRRVGGPCCQADLLPDGDGGLTLKPVGKRTIDFADIGTRLRISPLPLTMLP